MVAVTLIAGNAGEVGSGIPRPSTEPRASFFVYALAFSAVIGGFLFGYDTGVVSSGMLFVPQDPDMKGMTTLWQEVIIAITPGMAAIGALLSGNASDRFGRRKIRVASTTLLTISDFPFTIFIDCCAGKKYNVIIFSAIVFSLGGCLCGAAPEKVTLLIGRILLGIAIGFCSMAVPVYVCECAPLHIRGRLLTSFQLMINIGIVMASAIAGGFSYIDPVNVGWRLMFGFAAVPALLQLIAFYFLPESPRFLFAKGDEETARKVVLDRIYSGEAAWTEYEMAEIAFGYEQEKKAKAEQIDSGPVILRILRTPHVLKAVIVGCALQTFQQLSGVNTIVYYTGTIIRSAGVTDETTAIWISCGPAVMFCLFFVSHFDEIARVRSLPCNDRSLCIPSVDCPDKRKCCCAAVLCIFGLLPLSLAERVGRRPLLLVSMAGVIFSLFAMAATFILIHNDSADVVHDGYANFSEPEYCRQFSNCDSCVTDENCGFCQLMGTKTGVCLSFAGEIDRSASASGPCSSGQLREQKYEWQDNSCETKYTVVPIIIMVIYLAWFSIGYAPMPWTLNAEFYPLWARSTGCSLAAACNWIFNLIISVTFLSLSQAVTKYGAFFIYACCTVLALIFAFFMVPETKGKSIEEVEWLFMSASQRKRQAAKKPDAAAITLNEIRQPAS